MRAYSVDPRSASFRWVDRPLDGLRRLAREDVGRFNREGCCVLPAAAPPETLGVVTREIDGLEAELDGSQITLGGGTAYDYPRDTLTFVKNPILRAPSVRALLTGPLFADIAADLVGGSVRLYWDQAVYKAPGTGPEFPWHQDNGYTFTQPLAYITCWIALTDADAEAGCPAVIAGAHRRGVYRHVRGEWGLEIEGADQLSAEHGETPLPVAAGDVAVFSSLTPHRTGPNTSGHIRKALIAQYIADGAFVLDEADRWVSIDDAQRNPIVACA